MNEIEKLDKDHTAACRAYLDAADTFDDARKARDIAYAAYKTSAYKYSAYKAAAFIAADTTAIYYDKSIKDD